ncbi:unnamed protein product [Nesidiocoris tenuis]|uniref:Uncharacterized protein n=1 Tax=Nesidiocoris tenuis TaxID=355587 RepID=A0A6H5HUB1_9HEMI|nr:unnamed protein product [Nesidiocoris tenuis]
MRVEGRTVSQGNFYCVLSRFRTLVSWPRLGNHVKMRLWTFALLVCVLLVGFSECKRGKSPKIPKTQPRRTDTHQSNWDSRKRKENEDRTFAQRESSSNANQNAPGIGWNVPPKNGAPSAPSMYPAGNTGYNAGGRPAGQPYSAANPHSGQPYPGAQNGAHYPQSGYQSPAGSPVGGSNYGMNPGQSYPQQNAGYMGQPGGGYGQNAGYQQPAYPQSGFGQPAGYGQPSVYGQPGGFGQPSYGTGMFPSQGSGYRTGSSGGGFGTGLAGGLAGGLVGGAVGSLAVNAMTGGLRHRQNEYPDPKTESPVKDDQKPVATEQPPVVPGQPLAPGQQPLGPDQQPMGYNQQPFGYQQPMGYNPQPGGTQRFGLSSLPGRRRDWYRSSQRADNKYQTVCRNPSGNTVHFQLAIPDQLEWHFKHFVVVLFVLRHLWRFCYCQTSNLIVLK